MDVKIGQFTVTLVPPSPLAALAMSRGQEELEKNPGLLYALGALALFECYPPKKTWPTRPRPRNWRPGQRPEDLGKDIFDALVHEALGRGEDIAGLLRHIVDAYGFAVSTLLTQQEVTAAEDFSQAPKAGEGV